MALEWQILGRIGVEVEVTPVSGEAAGAQNSEVVIHTVEVPAGETWLVAAVGELSARYDDSFSSPDVYLGDHKHNGRTSTGALSIAAIADKPVTLRIKRSTGTGSDSFTGNIYTVKLDD